MNAVVDDRVGWVGGRRTVFEVNVEDLNHRGVEGEDVRELQADCVLSRPLNQLLYGVGGWMGGLGG